MQVENRVNALCMVCESLERHRAIYLGFQKEFSNKNLRILHICPNSCWKYVFKTNKYYTTMRHDARQTPFIRDSFDIIIAVHIMEHIVEDDIVFGEFNRILDKGGFLIAPVPLRGEKTIELELPHTPERMLKAFGNSDHCRQYGKQDYTDLMEEYFDVGIIGDHYEEIHYGRSRKNE